MKDNGIEDKLEKLVEKIQEMFEAGRITKEEYCELLNPDISIDEEISAIDAFKQAYKKRYPIKCSELIFKIFDEHQNNFRKALMLSDCIPDPLGMKYDTEEHEFCLHMLHRSIKMAKQKEYPKKLLSELSQIYFMLKMLNHNNLNNTRLLMENKFSEFSLSEQLRMICLYLQDQSRLFRNIQREELKGKDFVTGMESAVANRPTDFNPSVKMSIIDNYEGLIENYDTLIRYLYHSKSEELKTNLTIEHGDITHLHIPSFELITHISGQRVIYSELWEKFKYSQWELNIVREKNTEVYLLKPNNISKLRQHRIANLRRNYIVMLSIYKVNSSILQKSYRCVTDLSNTISIKNPKSLYSLKKEKFLIAKDYCNKLIISSYKENANDFYLNNSVNNIRTNDILKCFEFLHTLATCYELALFKEFDQEDMSNYKYLSPILSISALTNLFSDFYDINKSIAREIMMFFVFNNTLRSESDIFCRPLLYVGKDSILFCSTLITTINVNRVIEMLFLQYKVNISPIGTIFEKKLRLLMSIISSIKVNTNKLEFMAYDGRNVEFDFIGTFDDYLLLIEFKALVTPYSDKRLHHNEEIISEAVEQVLRRCKITQHDWDKICNLCNIDLPEKPIEPERIIKLVGTNIFDFNTLVYDGVRVVDESTLLKFFLSPKVEVVKANGQKVMSNKRLWKGERPTVQDFLEYLENPITISPYNGCFESQVKPFNRFEGDYQVAIIDEVLVKDPIANAIKEALNENHA